MNAECLMQWNRLKKEAGDFPLEKLERELQTYLHENTGSDEQGVRAALRSIREALTCREHEDEAVRHKAGKLLKSCRHSFDEVCKNAGHFRKALTEARERNAEEKASPRVIPLGGGFRLEEVLSIKMLMTIGKTLELCVAKREDARSYWKEAESGESGLWLLLKGEERFALLKIDLEEHKVGEFSAHDNDDPEISFELAMEILEKLGVTADDETSFARVGAFGRFKCGRPEGEPVRVGEQEMWVWLYEDELIVGMEEHADGKLFWSRFERKQKKYNPFEDPRSPWDLFSREEWEENTGNHLSMGMLFEIVRRNPHVLERFRSPVNAEPARVRKAA
ncbi:MAG: hypothetical protein OXE44_09600 [Nitrospinae bacterium]|nr:hypothetical protein [Nitrospinota bacterium]